MPVRLYFWYTVNEVTLNVKGASEQYTDYFKVGNFIEQEFFGVGTGLTTMTSLSTAQATINSRTLENVNGTTTLVTLNLTTTVNQAFNLNSHVNIVGSATTSTTSRSHRRCQPNCSPF